MKLGLAGLVGVLLSAQEGTPPALTRARAQYEQLEFSRALETADAALQVEPSPALRAQYQMIRALCFSAQKRDAPLEDAIEEVLKADPTLREDAWSESPSFLRIFRQVRMRLAGQVEVETDLRGGGIRVDGVVVGPAPTSQALTAGRHLIEVLDGSGSVVAQEEVVMYPQGRQKIILRAPLVRPMESVDAGTSDPPDAGLVPERADAGRTEALPISPFVSARLVVDPSCTTECTPSTVGVFSEVGGGVMGRLWLAEVSVVIAATAALALHAGPRIPFASDQLSAQLTADVVVFLESQPVWGLGARLGVAWHPLRFLDVLLEGAVRRHFPVAPTIFPMYGQLSLGVRGRWPSSAVP